LRTSSSSKKRSRRRDSPVWVYEQVKEGKTTNGTGNGNEFIESVRKAVEIM